MGKAAFSETVLRLMEDLTPEERLQFQVRYNALEKNPDVAFALNAFLGGVGAHHFYLGNVGRALLYLFFFWTFLPLLISVFELFTIRRRTRNDNERKAAELAEAIRSLRRRGLDAPAR